jgi:hypothetical protein
MSSETSGIGLTPGRPFLLGSDNGSCATVGEFHQEEGVGSRSLAAITSGSSDRPGSAVAGRALGCRGSSGLRITGDMAGNFGGDLEV